MISSEDLNDYISGHISPEPEQLRRLYRRTQLTSLYPRMCTDHVQGRLLSMLSGMIRPHKVLEIGAFTGYSALCLAEGMHPDGELHSIEIDDEAADRIRAEFDASPYGQAMHLHIGDALQIVPQLGISDWDLVLIDANKRQYPEYLEMIAPLMASGGYLLADNTLWDGKPALPEPPKDAQTQGVMRFNDMLSTDSRFTTAIIPVRDGLTIARRN